MAYKILPFAEIDIHESMDWYYIQNAGLENDFLLEIKKTMLHVDQNPYSYQTRYKRKGQEIRYASVERFPFIIAFFVDEIIKATIFSLFGTPLATLKI